MSKYKIDLVEGVITIISDERVMSRITPNNSLNYDTFKMQGFNSLAALSKAKNKLIEKYAPIEHQIHTFGEFKRYLNEHLADYCADVVKYILGTECRNNDVDRLNKVLELLQTDYAVGDHTYNFILDVMKQQYPLIGAEEANRRRFNKTSGINKCIDLDALKGVKGIGKVILSRIKAALAAGEIVVLDDLLKVKGIGSAIFSRIERIKTY